jgi:aminopeptidase
MRDVRIEELARILTGYSTQVSKGDIVLVSASGVESLPLVKAVHAEALRKGARYVEVQYDFPDLARQFYDLAGDEQLTFFPEHRLEFMKKVDVSIGISAPANAMTMARADQGKMLTHQKLLRPIIDQRVRHTRWVITRFPTAGAAQDARMSLDEYEDFFFAACNRDWSEGSAKQERLKNLLQSTDRVRIVARDTDLRFAITGMPAIKCDGRFNIPDGEVFTAPLRESVEGHITFNAPALYSGREFNDIRLEFSRGKIVKASAAQDEEGLNRIFDTDAGARYLGEFAVGVNAGISSPMRNVLFDEKIFGSVHLAAGSAYEECNNGNQSAVHWDMVRLLNDGGELFFDDELIIRNGRFTHPDLLDLNPKESGR